MCLVCNYLALHMVVDAIVLDLVTWRVIICPTAYSSYLGEILCITARVNWEPIVVTIQN